MPSETTPSDIEPTLLVTQVEEKLHATFRIAYGVSRYPEYLERLGFASTTELVAALPFDIDRFLMANFLFDRDVPEHHRDAHFRTLVGGTKVLMRHPPKSTDTSDLVIIQLRDLDRYDEIVQEIDDPTLTPKGM